MREVFKIARLVDDTGTLQILPEPYGHYPTKEDISKLPPGTYQIQKFFVVE